MDVVRQALETAGVPQAVSLVKLHLYRHNP
jgi:hypothetical protein